MRTASLVFLAAALAAPAGAQSAGKSKVPVSKAAAMAKARATERAERMLYRAYWLDNVEKKRAEALELYQSFLVAAPDHAAAPRAAAYALDILRLTSRREAREFTQKHAALLEKVDTEVTEEIDDRSGRGRGGRGRRGSDRGRNGDGDRGRGRGRERGERTEAGGTSTKPLTARMSTRLPDMTKTQVDAFLTRYGKMADDYLAELRKNDNRRKAAKLSKTVSEIKKLIRARELVRAQDAIDAMQNSLR